MTMTIRPVSTIEFIGLSDGSSGRGFLNYFFRINRLGENLWGHACLHRNLLKTLADMRKVGSAIL